MEKYRSKIGCNVLAGAILLGTVMPGWASEGELTKDYSYVSGGGIISALSDPVPVNITTLQQDSSLVGYYGNVHMSFDNNVNADVRYSSVSKESLFFNQTFVGAGYWFPVNETFGISGTVGMESMEIGYDGIELASLGVGGSLGGLDMFGGFQETGFAGEVSAHLMKADWRAGVAYKYTSYDRPMHEIRLDCAKALSGSFWGEVGLRYVIKEFDYFSDSAQFSSLDNIQETSLRLGLRYVF